MQIGQNKCLHKTILKKLAVHSYLIAYKSIENSFERKSSLSPCINANFDSTLVSSADKTIFFYMSE